MNCEEKDRLLREYEAATVAFSAAVKEPRLRMGGDPATAYLLPTIRKRRQFCNGRIIVTRKWPNNRITRFSEGKTEKSRKPVFQNSGKIGGPSVRVAADEENQDIAKISVIT